MYVWEKLYIAHINKFCDFNPFNFFASSSLSFYLTHSQHLVLLLWLLVSLADIFIEVISFVQHKSSLSLYEKIHCLRGFLYLQLISTVKKLQLLSLISHLVHSSIFDKYIYFGNILTSIPHNTFFVCRKLPPHHNTLLSLPLTIYVEIFSHSRSQLIHYLLHMCMS